jgi:hypothetical protein
MTLRTKLAGFLVLGAGNAALISVLGETETSVGIALITTVFLGFNLVLLAVHHWADSPVLIQGSQPLRVFLATILALLTVSCLIFEKSHSPGHRTQIPDPLTGWKTAPDFQAVIHSSLFGTAHYSTGNHGFRVFGQTRTPRRKLLVIGNSPTQAVQVSDGEAYFNRLGGPETGLELFAYGCGGFNTLQEYCILDRYLELIQPDLVLWQLTSHDLVYNLHDIEKQSFFKNNHATRPYWENGTLVQRYSREYPFHLEILAQVSGLCRLLQVRYDDALFHYDRRQTIEARLPPDHPLLVAAIRTTGEILTRGRKRAGNAAFFAFNTDSDEVFPELAANAGITYIQGVAEVIAAANRNGQRVDGRPYDLHWNTLGHRLVGEHLRRFLLTHRL